MLIPPISINSPIASPNCLSRSGFQVHVLAAALGHVGELYNPSSPATSLSFTVIPAALSDIFTVGIPRRAMLLVSPAPEAGASALLK